MPARFLVCAVLFALPTIVQAQSEGSPPACPPHSVALEPQELPGRSLRDLSLTVGLPAHLVFSGLEAKAELRLHDRVGLAAYGGMGSIIGAGYYQVGGQLRWYAVGNFDQGMVLGVDLNYLAVEKRVELLGFTILDAKGTAFAPGGLVGYKVALDSGLTVELDLGLRRHSISYSAAEHVSEEKLEVSSDTTLWWPIIELGLGWSF